MDRAAECESPVREVVEDVGSGLAGVHLKCALGGVVYYV